MFYIIIYDIFYFRKKRKETGRFQEFIGPETARKDKKLGVLAGWHSENDSPFSSVSVKTSPTDSSVQMIA